MSAVESLVPYERVPRRGDMVVAAPNAPACISGQVTGYAGERVAVKTVKTGVVSLPASRFTWSRRRDAWVCWPADVVRTIRNMEHQYDELACLPRPMIYAQIGDFMRVNGRGGWVMRLQGKPVPIERDGAIVQGMMREALKAYVVSVAPGETVEVDISSVQFDERRKTWIAIS